MGKLQMLRRMFEIAMFEIVVFELAVVWFIRAENPMKKRVIRGELGSFRSVVPESRC